MKALTCSRRRWLLNATVLPLVLSATTALADEVVSAIQIIKEAEISVNRARVKYRKSGDLDDLLQAAKGVLIFPHFYKAGFFVGGAYGDGVLLSLMPEGGFSDPAFYRITAASIGFQFGLQSAVLLYIINSEKAMTSILDDEFKLGATAGLSIGPFGVGGEEATTTNLSHDITAYSTSTGLFAGGALEGATIKPRKDWNAAVYGVGNDDPRSILQRTKINAAIKLREALVRNIYSSEPGLN